MKETKVVKFGGSSLADAKQFKKVADIILADPTRCFVVASAPGKRFVEDIKVTDMLYKCYELASEGENFDEEFQAIKDRFNGIISELGIEDFSLETEFEAIKGEAGTNSFVLTPKRWVESTNAIGIVTKGGRYAKSYSTGTYTAADFVYLCKRSRFTKYGIIW